MVDISPALYVMTPVFFLAVLRKRWALYLFFAFMPFYRLGLFVTIDHPFNPPEIAVLILGGHYLKEAFNTGTLRLPERTTLTWAIGFLSVSMVSVLYLVFHVPDFSVHPYTWGFANQALRQVEVSRFNISQLLLRVFAIGVILVLAVTIQRQHLKNAIRAVVAGALFAGLVGVGYQLSILLDWSYVPRFLQWFGFAKFPVNPNRVGPLPRLYSVSAEPGRTSVLFLLGLGYTVPALLAPSDESVFRQSEAIFASIALFILIGLSTATTGIGGLVILIVTLVGATVTFSELSIKRLYLILATLLGALVVGLLVLLGDDTQGYITYQLSKLTFAEHSGETRIEYLLHSFKVLEIRPLLGVGVGSHSAPSMLATILVESGLLGLLMFVGLATTIFTRTRSQTLANIKDKSLVGIILLVGGVSTFSTLFLVHPIGSLQQPWFWVSLALPLAYISNK